jgi:predicted short-subunit dehydrogenase-like oxidoreductase (DUF2520 family)
MKVVIIGSGNVATVIGGRIVAAGHTVLQVMARQEAAAAGLAREWGCSYSTEWAEVTREGELYIVALSDTALAGLGEVLQLPGSLVVHTAGAAAAAVLRPVSERYGVLYPLQSLRRNIRPFPEFPLLIDAAQPADLSLLEGFAQSLSNQVRRADDASRLKLHVAAVLINNFSNHLYTLSAGFCQREGVDFSLLLPIIRETAARVERYPPQEVQTGPAIRGDAGTIRRHLDVLSNYDDIKELYRVFSDQIEAYYRNG